MAKDWRMNTKYLYAAILLIVLSAWFGHSTSKPPAAHKPQEEDSKKVVSQIIKNPATLGIKPGEWTVGGKCNVEFINGKPMDVKVYPVAKDYGTLQLVGWALDAEKERLPRQVVVRFTSIGNTDYYASSQIGLLRDDVKEYFKLPDRVSFSGFELLANVRELPASEYAITLIMIYEDSTCICDNGRKIQVQ